MNVTAPDQFWEPVRKSMVRNMLGYVPAINSNGRISVSSMVPSPDPLGSVDLGSQGWSLPVVTYISRQGAGRRLRNEDHQLLVKSLKKLEEDGLCILQIPMMERLSLQEQVATIAKTTVSPLSIGFASVIFTPSVDPGRRPWEWSNGTCSSIMPDVLSQSFSLASTYYAALTSFRYFRDHGSSM